MEKEKNVFSIPSINMSTLNYKIEKLNKRAKKLGLPEIITKVLKTEEVEHHHTDKETLRTIKYKLTHYHIEIDGLSPKIPGWTFLGTIEHLNGKNILRMLPGESIPSDYYKTISAKCDHCQKTRNRKDTYLIKNKDGSIKQVGHQCIKDFLGHADPNHLAFIASFIREIESMRDPEFKGKREQITLLTIEFLYHAAQFVLTYGFIRKHSESGSTPTSERAWNNATSIPTTEKERQEKLKITSEAKSLATKAYAWGLSLKEKPNMSDYEYNLTTALCLELISKKHTGILASLIHTYQKHIGKEISYKKKDDSFKNSKYFGEVKKRDLFDLTVITSYSFDSQFGTLTCYKMLDQNQNVAVWFTSSGNVEVGKKYKIKATVKKHEEYKGIKQTVLSRCSIEEEV